MIQCMLFGIYYEYFLMKFLNFKFFNLFKFNLLHNKAINNIF